MILFILCNVINKNFFTFLVPLLTTWQDCGKLKVEQLNKNTQGIRNQ